MAEAIMASAHRMNFSLWHGLVRWQWPHLVGRGICPVPLSLLGLATGLRMQTEGGLRAGRDNPALSVTAREQTQLCSFRTFGLCSPRLKPKVAELIARQPAARCFEQLPREGLCPTADGNADAAQVSLSFALLQDPQTQPISRVLLSVLVGGDCQWGVSPPLVLLAGNLFSCLAWCRLSRWLVLCPRPACGPLSHLGQMLDSPCFWPACSTPPS